MTTLRSQPLRLLSDSEFLRKPFGFFKRHLIRTRDSTFEKELLAIFAATTKFKHLIKRHHTVVFSDRKPMTSLSSPKPEQHQQHSTVSKISPLAEYNGDIQHISRSTNKLFVTTNRRHSNNRSIKVNILCRHR